MIRNHFAAGVVVYADEGTAWDDLEWTYETKWVNHSLHYYDKGVCTNQAESYNSRLRRAEIGTHHRISSDNLDSYVGKMVWREDSRCVDNGGKVAMLLRAAIQFPISRRWSKYWQRHFSK